MALPLMAPAPASFGEVRAIVTTRTSQSYASLYRPSAQLPVCELLLECEGCDDDERLDLCVNLDN